MFIYYLGNKRKLVEKIWEHFEEAKLSLDLFSGSGAVSHFLRSKGVTVHANDIAPYTYHINKTLLEINDDEFPQDLLDRLNKISSPKKEHYISEHYSGKRLFFTKENAMIIDGILECIWSLSDELLRSIALACLIYQMSVKANTSGMFKSFHKKIAGGDRNKGVHKRVHKSNSKRITNKIMLEKPVIPIGPKGKSFQEDACNFLKHSDFYDVIYIDPPYNEHQYSGNYHLLEQVCRPFEERYTPKDNQKSGIQPDLYKSPYSSIKKHEQEFIKLFDLVNNRTKKVIVSYNNNGHVKNMAELMKNIFGNCEEYSVDHFNYRGGKPTNQSSQELLFISKCNI